MTERPFHHHTAATADDTSALARSMAPLLRPGDTLLLAGPIGAGKTHFARSLIRALQGPLSREDIPSPTFTLVQTYDSPVGEVWHADLYRLTDVSELFELGLEEAFETAICLIEWPERLGQMAPQHALTLRIEPGPDEDQRRIHFSGADDWRRRLAPALIPEPTA